MVCSGLILFAILFLINCFSDYQERENMSFEQKICSAPNPLKHDKKVWHHVVFFHKQNLRG